MGTIPAIVLPCAVGAGASLRLGDLNYRRVEDGALHSDRQGDCVGAFNQSSVEPLPPPPEAPITGVYLDLLRTHELYLKAWISCNAIDHPASKWAGIREIDKAPLRAKRAVELAALTEQYLFGLAAAEKRAKNRKVKKAKEIQKKKNLSELGRQHRLFEDAWPERFSYIAERFPRRPFVSNNLDFGVTVRPINDGCVWKYIQYNSPVADHLMIIDYDCSRNPDGSEGLDVGEVWKEKNLPCPTWISRTPGTRKGHIAFALKTPVLTSDAAKLKPLQYLARIEQGYLKALNGDPGFAGTLTKNPIADAWDVQWIESTAYTLDELAEHVEIPRYTSKKCKKCVEVAIEAVGLGRKVLTFEKVRHWAYSAVSQYWGLGAQAWHAAVIDEVNQVNASYTVPLPLSHCKSIAKSVSKWVWKRFTPLSRQKLVDDTHGPDDQARRGAKKGKKRRDELMPRAIEMREAGATQREIAAELGVVQKTVSNWLSSLE